MSIRYLTKSRFVLGMECPAKLFYVGKPDYADQKKGDTFLQALAEGGFQVGELAKKYYPDGIQVESKNSLIALQQTVELMQRENVIIFEAAFLYQNLFLRADILIKSGNLIDLIEVKSKSFNPKKDTFSTKRGKPNIIAKWERVLYDVAFQTYVLKQLFPNYQISPYLMVADKSAFCPTTGLNQKFRIKKDASNRVFILCDEISSDDLDPRILCKQNVNKEVELILNSRYQDETKDFEEYVEFLSSNYVANIKITPKLGSICKSCEFRTSTDNPENLKSGFQECWMQYGGFSPEDFNEPTVLDIWNSKKIDSFIADGKLHMKQLEEFDINPMSDDAPGLSLTQRQWLQIEKVKNNDSDLEIDIPNLRREMEQWKYPLNFIDFETTRVAIPFNKGEHPYEGIAFQFSHHLLHEDGKVEHTGEYINRKFGNNPNIDFVRALKQSLEKNNGTIFRYAMHENSVLNEICAQIQLQEIIDDKDELITFIKSITSSPGEKKGIKKIGERCMLDLCYLVQRYYYDPLTKGSTSIKHVFPAILARSTWLQQKYGQPIYGAEDGIPSLNFKNCQWLKKEGDKVLDPYSLLPKLFESTPLGDEVKLLFLGGSIKEGGSASIAYARMQFSEMSDVERAELTQALLNYCELDTLAMVMIVETWRELLKKKKRNEL